MGIYSIGFAHSAALFGIHPWCFSHRITVLGDGTGQDGAIRRGTLNAPQCISISLGTPSDPGNGPANLRDGRGKILSINHLSTVGGQDGVDMFTRVGVNTHDTWVSMRHNRHNGGCTSNVMDLVNWPLRGRHQSGYIITSEHSCDGSHQK